MKRFRAPIVCFVAIAVFALVGAAPFIEDLRAQEKKPSPEFGPVQEILTRHCLMCHSGPKPPDGLRLDSYENTMAGGKHGKVVVPGSPDKSELLKYIKGISKPRMPKNGPPWLSASEEAAIEKWIAGGAS